MSKSAGKLVWYLAWPFWWVYFKIYSDRSRVLVMYGDKVLLVRGVIGDGKWGLPGGGAHKGEPLEQSAVRELAEEVGVIALPEQLEPLGSLTHNDAGLTYRPHFFVYRPAAEVKTKRRKGEIAELGWFDKSQLESLPLNADARAAFAEFGNRIWYTKS